MELYPTLTTANYLKGYRYNMHLCEKFLLIELGNQNSTVSEAKNAMEPFAKVLSEVLEGEK
jgi:stage II sporulation protein P